jgi:hypothetical protein
MAPNGTRDIHGMILSAAASTATEGPGSNAAGQRVPDALEKPLAYRHGDGDRDQGQGDEVAGVSHSFLTD